MKKIILSAIASLTLITGTLIVINMNKQPETIDNTAPEPVQSVIEHETVIDAPEEVEAAVEAPEGLVESNAVETAEVEIISREPTFDELSYKYDVSDHPKLQYIRNSFDRSIIRDPEEKFMMALIRNGVDRLHINPEAYQDMISRYFDN